MADFDWRISVAEVAAPGPFSCFEGVDRVLTVLEGELVLTFDDGAKPVRLTNRSAPYPFAGNVPVSGTPLGGVVVRDSEEDHHLTDLDAMVIQGGGRLPLPPRTTLRPRPCWLRRPSGQIPEGRNDLAAALANPAAS